MHNSTHTLTHTDSFSLQMKHAFHGMGFKMTLIISLFMVFYSFQIFYRIRKRKEEIKREGRMRERRRQKEREGEGWGHRGRGRERDALS